MSETATRLPLADAQDLADALYGRLWDASARLEIAGSIRRKKETVGDIEFCAIPLMAAQFDLFGEPSGTPRNLLEERVNALLDNGTLRPRPTPSGQLRLGPKYKALRYQGVGVDVFITDVDCWGLIYTIRTGPAGWSKRLVTPCRQGGMLPDYMRVKDGRIWDGHGEALATPEEADVFAVIGQEWIEPEQRR